MKRILLYGDSNTWGYDPATGERFPEDVRWPGVLARALGEGYRVVEEGLNGRTTVHDDPIEEHRNGRTYLRPCLETHKPLDLVAIMLGTNDLHARFGLSASDIAASAGALARIVLASSAGPGGGAPAVLLVAPPPVIPLPEDLELLAGAEEKSRRFPERYRRVAERRGCYFMDAGAVVEPSDLDGVHLDAGAHRVLGEAVAARVQEMLGERVRRH
jgi:lysophospholipase L1-like esterase